MNPSERLALYTTAIQTGLRSNELRSLTRGKLFLDDEKPFIICKASIVLLVAVLQLIRREFLRETDLWAKSPIGGEGIELNLEMYGKNRFLTEPR